MDCCFLDSTAWHISASDFEAAASVPEGEQPAPPRSSAQILKTKINKHLEDLRIRKQLLEVEPHHRDFQQQAKYDLEMRSKAQTFRPQHHELIVQYGEYLSRKRRDLMITCNDAETMGRFMEEFARHHEVCKLAKEYSGEYLEGLAKLNGRLKKWDKMQKEGLLVVFEQDEAGDDVNC